MINAATRAYLHILNKAEQAAAGVTGANFAIAETGTIALESTDEQVRLATLGELVAAVGADADAVRAALLTICRAGRATFDLARGVYRHRELFPEPLPPMITMISP